MSKSRSWLPSIVVLAVLAAVLVGAYFFGKTSGGRRMLLAFESRAAKERLVAEMQYKLQTAAEAEKNAVMAITDEESASFAEESRGVSADVEAARKKLGRLIDADGRQEEIEPFAQFSEAWKKHQRLDREVLALAVENTNLKAMKLSFGPAKEALQQMEAALGATTTADSTAQQAASQALVAALKVHALQARHIAEANDAEMDRIEEEMATFDRQAKEGLGAIASDEAQAAYSQFQEINTKIIELSRRNSNVRSAAISLGEKRQVTAECRKLLSALHEAIQSDRVAATR
jgi:hypothetical protein